MAKENEKKIKILQRFGDKREPSEATDHYVNINTIAKATGLTKATIKWWLKNGLIKAKRDPNNNYLLFPIFKTILALHDIYFFRQLDISIKNINKLLHGFSEQEMRQFYIDEIKNVDEKIKRLFMTKQILDERLERLNIIETQKYSFAKLKAPKFDTIVGWDNDNFKLLKKKLKENLPDVSIAWPSTDSFSGIASNGETLGGEVIWKKDPDKIYVEFLFYDAYVKQNKKETEGIFSRQFFNFFGDLKPPISDVQLYVDEARKSGYSVDCVIAEWIINIKEESVEYGYFKLWFELRPMTEAEKSKYGVLNILPIDKLVGK